mmetsp:Transcript_5467/g.16855  ORF Transcript_5467/g.16855 Transcript_5467/m.16855 type:complete len:480 (+) Transcript_5467:464-1903(+)
MILDDTLLLSSACKRKCAGHLVCMARNAMACSSTQDMAKRSSIWWQTCACCVHSYSREIKLAMAALCWLASAGQPENEWNRCEALKILSDSFVHTQRVDDALPVLRERENLLAKFWPHEHQLILEIKLNIANLLNSAGQVDDHLCHLHDLHEYAVLHYGAASEQAMLYVSLLCSTLYGQGRFKEGEAFVLEQLVVFDNNPDERHRNELSLLHHAATFICDNPEHRSPQNEAQAILARVRELYERGDADEIQVTAVEQLMGQMMEIILAFDRACAMAAAAHASAVASCAHAAEHAATCYLCLEGNEREGLVRGCACRETLTTCAGFVHISCLARHASWSTRIDDLTADETPAAWMICRLCRRPFSGEIELAMASAYWKKHVRIRSTAQHLPGHRGAAMKTFGDALVTRGRYEEALPILEMYLEDSRGGGYGQEFDFVLYENARDSLADCLRSLGQDDRALEIIASVNKTIEALKRLTSTQ